MQRFPFLHKYQFSLVGPSSCCGKFKYPIRIITYIIIEIITIPINGAKTSTANARANQALGRF